MFWKKKTQFCLDQNVWDSPLGKAAAGDTGMEGWREVTRKVTANKRSTNKPGPRKRNKPKEPPRPLDEWFAGEDKANPLSNAVSIPVEELNRLWSRCQPILPKVDTAVAKMAMKKVHEAMQKLRACYTEIAVEKASIAVAAAFLGMLSLQNVCENPFLCLQQAAIFASHGTKRGNSDDLFRGRLPELTECGAEEALVILGRADCFQSVHFPYEAAYLCSYVARLCSLHRQSAASSNDEDDEVAKDDKVLEWNDKWMIVSILCYNVSIMIRTTVKKALAASQQILRKEEFDPWDQEVVDEFLMGRADAVAWKSALTKGEIFMAEELSQEDDANQTERPVEPSATAIV